MISDPPHYLRVCVVGAGMIFQRYHLPAIMSNNHLRLHAIIDKDPHVASGIAEKLNVMYSCDLTDVESSDLCLIATPPHTRESLVTTALRKGMHVFCEKPFSFTAHSARKMINVASRAGKRIYVSQTRRFYPNLQLLRQFAGDFLAEDPLSIYYYEGAPYKWQSISCDRAVINPTDYGVVHDLGAHVFDYIAKLLGDLRVSNGDISVKRSLIDREPMPNNFHGSLLWRNRSVSGTVSVRLSRSIAMANILVIHGSSFSVSTRLPFDTSVYLKKKGSEVYRILQADTDVHRVTTASVFHTAWNSVVTDLLDLEKERDYVDLQAKSVLPGLHMIDKVISSSSVKAFDQYFLAATDAWTK